MSGHRASEIIRQRTPEWYIARVGKFTASNFFELMGKPVEKSEQLSKSAINYVQTIARQIYFNEHNLRPENDATRWGMRYEDEALREFGKASGFSIIESGFMIHPLFPDIGATPDAIVVENNDPDRLVLAQIKCPYSQKNHLQYKKKITDAATLKKYRAAIYWQIQGEIWVAGASHSYFVSFDPRLWERKRLHYAMIERDQTAIEQLESIIPKAVELRNEFLEEYRISDFSS